MKPPVKSLHALVGALCLTFVSIGCPNQVTHSVIDTKYKPKLHNLSNGMDVFGRFGQELKRDDGTIVAISIIPKSSSNLTVYDKCDGEVIVRYMGDIILEKLTINVEGEEFPVWSEVGVAYLNEKYRERYNVPSQCNLSGD